MNDISLSQKALQNINAILVRPVWHGDSETCGILNQFCRLNPNRGYGVIIYMFFYASKH